MEIQTRSLASLRAKLERDWQRAGLVRNIDDVDAASLLLRGSTS
jgi:hypothetical protein